MPGRSPVERSETLLSTSIRLLGPQRFEPTVARALDDLGVEGSIAAVTAGWQERELEDDELRDHVARPVVNLELYRRSERVYAEDPELFEGLRARQDRLRALQRLYRRRLRLTLRCARELFARQGPPDLLEPEREDAIEAARALDAHHLRRVSEVHETFEATWRPGDRPAVRREREAVAAILAHCGVLAIAGGHVAALQNRLRLFDVLSERLTVPVIAWSAGAMVLTPRVVLFHDSPPQGAGDPEVLDRGLGFAPGVVVLPHASERLRLEDESRVALFARRFSPDRSVTLDPSAELDVRGEHGSVPRGTARRLTEGGAVTEVESW